MTHLGTYGADFTTPGTSAEIQLQLVVDYTQSVAGNYTDISWVFQMVEYVNASPFNLNPTSSASASINGTVFSAGNLTYDFRATNVTIVIASGTRRIYHNSVGEAKNIPISASYNGGSPIGTASFSTTFDLPTIPRASTPTFSDSTPDAGDSITINTNRADGAFTHDIEYRWQGSGSGFTLIAAGVGASTVWTVPSSFIAEIPNAPSRTLEIRTTTKSGASTIGTSTTTLAVDVPAAIVPDFGTVAHAEAVTSPDIAALIGGYVAGASKLTLDITSAVAGDGATVTSKVVQVRNGDVVLQTVDVTAGPATSGTINATGALTLRGIVTDSRGRTHAEDVSITSLVYSLPTVASIGLSRALSDGTPNEEGQYIRVDLDAAVASLVVGGTERNALTVRVSTSPRGAGTWTVNATSTPGGISFSSHLEVGTFAISDAFDVKVEVYDKLTGSAPLVFLGAISTAGVFLHLGNSGEGLGVGEYWQQGDVDKPASVWAKGYFYQAGNRVLDTTDGPETRTITYTTSSLANGATETGVIELRTGFTILHFKAVQAARFRAYQSTAHRTADASRAVGVVPSGDHGLIFEDDGSAAADYATVVVGGLLAGQTSCPISVTNRSGATRTITIELEVRV